MENFHTSKHLRVENITLRIKNEGLMLDYYLNILKMRIIKQEEKTFYLGTSEGHVLVILVVDENAKVVNNTIGLYHYALLLPTRRDLANFLRHYLKSSGRFVGASNHLVSEAVYLEDPEGNGIEVYVDRPSSLWRDFKNNITMTTAPLDIDNLFLFADETYTNIPNRTIMGHLHLHVDNLSAAREFYHDILGFDVVLSYGNSAEFLSNQGYHHHIAYNVWRTKALPDDVIITGLLRYTLHATPAQKETIKQQLIERNAAYIDENDMITFRDVNGSEVVVYTLA